MVCSMWSFNCSVSYDVKIVFINEIKNTCWTVDRMIYFIVLWFCYFLVSECAAFQKHHDEMSDRNRYAITFDKEADYPTYYESVKLQQAVCANVVEQPSLHLTPPWSCRLCCSVTVCSCLLCNTIVLSGSVSKMCVLLMPVYEFVFMLCICLYAQSSPVWKVREKTHVQWVIEVYGCWYVTFVVCPTMSCFANRSKCRHVTFVIIECRTCQQSTDQHSYVKDSSYGNKYLTKINVNVQTKVEICISCYLNADVLSYSAAYWSELYERNSVCQVVDRS